MPPVRLSRRRRSSLAITAKPGYYPINLSPSPRPVTFAPNITPVSYVDPDSSASPSSFDDSLSPTSTLFPPSVSPPPIPSRRRVPPGKRRSLGYIPRPPNAFMLFRADFVRQKHVPGSIETNHGSLSKIIGNCWKSLPLEEKRVWELKAKHAKAEHKARYPEYRFRPVHNKNKDKKKDKPSPSVEDERRCEEVAQLLLEGKKGDELAAAVRNLDRSKRADDDTTNDRHNPHQPPYFQHNHYHHHVNPHPPHPARGHRRSSSVPLPNDYPSLMAMPTLPFLTLSRPDSPVGNISRSTRLMLGQRRASSARPALARAWTLPMAAPTSLQQDDSPLPEADTSLFEQSFLQSNFSFPSTHDSTFNLHDVLTSLPPHATPHDLPPLGPLDNIAPHQLQLHQQPHYSPSTIPELEPSPSTQLQGLQLDPHTWLPIELGSAAATPSSYTSSANSGSPDSAHGLLPLPPHCLASGPGTPVVLAPQPQHHHAQVQPRFSVMWKEFTRAFEEGGQGAGMFEYGDGVQQQQQQQSQHGQQQQGGLEMGMGSEMDVQFQHGQDVNAGFDHHQQQHHQQQYNAGLGLGVVGLDSLFDDQGYGVQQAHQQCDGQQQGHGMDLECDRAMGGFGFDFGTGGEMGTAVVV